jgi:hypothetical protein
MTLHRQLARKVAKAENGFVCTVFEQTRSSFLKFWCLLHFLRSRINSRTDERPKPGPQRDSVGAHKVGNVPCRPTNIRLSARRVRQTYICIAATRTCRACPLGSRESHERRFGNSQVVGPLYVYSDAQLTARSTTLLRRSRKRTSSCQVE